MKNLKMLPWLAKKAGIPFTRAEELWREAQDLAARKCPAGESAEYWKTATRHLTESIAAESSALRTTPCAFAPLLRLPAQFWLQGLALQVSLMTIAANSTRLRHGC